MVIQNNQQIFNLPNHSFTKGLKEAAISAEKIYTIREVAPSPFSSLIQTTLFQDSLDVEYEAYNSNPQRRKYLKAKKLIQTIFWLKERIENCPFGEWLHKRCRGCGTIVKKNAFQMTCLSGYCKDGKCIKSRKSMVFLKLDNYKIYTPRLYHFSINFRPIAKITDSHRQECDRTASLVMKKLRRRIVNLKYIMVRDLGRSKKGIRVHYHVYMFGYKGIRLPGEIIQSTIKTLSASLGIVFDSQLIGFKPKHSLFDYASKRVAGIFGDVKKGGRFCYEDLISLEDYVKIFYHKRKLWLHLPNVRRVATEFIEVLGDGPKICPHCGGTKFILSKSYEDKPPPPKFYSDFGHHFPKNVCFSEIEVSKTSQERDGGLLNREAKSGCKIDRRSGQSSSFSEEETNSQRRQNIVYHNSQEPKPEISKRLSVGVMNPTIFANGSWLPNKIINTQINNVEGGREK